MEYDIDDTPIKTKYAPEIINPAAGIKCSPDAVFKKMRRITGTQQSFFYKTDAKRFIKQAEFMETFTDDYKGKALAELQFPSYDVLNDAQLRTYFTWRTKLRRGVVERTSLSFVFLYVYELINNIGVKNSVEGIEKLIFLWKEYRQLDHQIERYLVKWVKDYYICNSFDAAFKEIVCQHGLERYYSNLFLCQDEASYTYGELSGISNYKFETSNYYTVQNEVILADCFNNTILHLTPLLDMYGMNWENIILGVIEIQNWWAPLESAIYLDTTACNKTVHLSPYERYTFENGRWTAYKPAGNSTAAAMIFGYIIKKIESNLRNFAGHKHNLNANRTILIDALEKLYGTVPYLDVMVSDPMFDSIINDTSATCFTPKVELLTISEKLEHEFKKMPYPLLKEMRTSKGLEKINDPEQLFCMQAKILYHGEDNTPAVIPFEKNLPTYTSMNNEQIRYYLTWRSSARRGEFYEVPEAYLRLYFFELINNIGAKSEFYTIKKMADILLYYPEISKALEKTLCNWLKEYYICGNFTCSFYDVIRECKIEHFYPNVTLEFSEVPNLKLYIKMANYKIEKSKFYTDAMRNMIEGCLNQVINSVIAYFREGSVDFKQILAGKGEATNWRYPFSQAIHYEYTPLKSRKCILCSNEIYSYSNGFWDYVILPEKNTAAAYLTGYLVKRMEADIRTITKYKYKLSAEISSLISKLPYNNSLLRKMITNPKFDQTIDSAVLEYMRENHPEAFEQPHSLPKQPEELVEPVEMKLDPGKFDKIRIEAEKTREILTTEESATEESAIKEENADAALPPDYKKEGHLQADTENPWQTLYAKLNPIQTTAIKLILDGAGVENEILCLSRNNKLLPEVLLEGINEIALVCLGDTIIETTEGVPYIYDEYLEKAKDTFRRN